MNVKHIKKGVTQYHDENSIDTPRKKDGVCGDTKDRLQKNKKHSTHARTVKSNTTWYLANIDAISAYGFQPLTFT